MPNYLSDIANSFNRSVAEPVGNMLSNLSMPDVVRNQWAQGEPWRIASGALMMGDPATAKQVIEQRFANTTPQDVYQGSVDAGLGMAPMGISGGLAGIFAGVGAKTADVAKLGLAQEMKAAGIPDEQIWNQTGWTSGFPDGKWRFEIPDNASTVTPFDKLKSWGSAEDLRRGNTTTGAVSDFMQHPELQNNYDGMMDFGNADKRITMRVVPGKQGASFNEGEMTGFGQSGQDITIGTEGNTINKSNAIHELQHAIQQREGFARGGSPAQLESQIAATKSGLIAATKNVDVNQAMQNLANDANYQSFLHTIPVEEQKNLAIARELQSKGFQVSAAEVPTLLQSQELKGINSQYEAYKRLAGEAEARLTQARMNLTPEQRLAQYPVSQFDVPVQDQIVRYGDGVSQSKLDNLSIARIHAEQNHISSIRESAKNAPDSLALMLNNEATRREEMLNAGTSPYAEGLKPSMLFGDGQAMSVPLYMINDKGMTIPNPKAFERGMTLTQKGAFDGLQGWVKDYEAMRETGNLKGAIAAKKNIDAQIAKHGLDANEVYGVDPNPARIAAKYGHDLQKGSIDPEIAAAIAGGLITVGAGAGMGYLMSSPDSFLRP